MCKEQLSVIRSWQTGDFTQQQLEHTVSTGEVEEEWIEVDEEKDEPSTSQARRALYKTVNTCDDELASPLHLAVKQKPTHTAGKSI